MVAVLYYLHLLSCAPVQSNLNIPIGMEQNENMPPFYLATPFYRWVEPTTRSTAKLLREWSGGHGKAKNCPRKMRTNRRCASTIEAHETSGSGVEYKEAVLHLG